MSQFQITLFSLVLMALILLAAFFACAETGLMAVNRYRLRHKARLKKRYAVRVLKLLKHPDQLLSILLIGSTFTNILASSLATLIAFHFWGDKGALLAAILLTFVILIFAEIAPKTLAALYPERVARWVSYPVQIILKLFYPIVWLANIITHAIFRLLRIRITSFAVEPLSREELRSFVYDTSGKVSRQYQNMLLSILDLNKMTVDDVMIPRNEMLGIDIEQSWDAMVEQMNRFQQDWVPVYRNNINQLIGVLYLRNLLRLLLNAPETRPAKLALDATNANKELLEQVIQEPYFVPEGTALNVQLAYFQQSQDKMAFVVDEYGEIQGMLTLNDILEEIVGDFTSSMAQAKRIEEQQDGSYLVDGTVTIREFNRATDFELPVGGPRTLNGLIIEYLEALPRTSTAILIAGYPVEMVQVEDNRVKLARIFPRLKQQEEHHY